MNGWAWVQLLAATSGLVVAVLAVWRGGKSRLAPPLALLGLDQFAISLATFGGEVTGDPRYNWLGAVAAPVFPAFALQFVITFTGRRRKLAPASLAAWLIFGLQALAAAGAGLFEVPTAAIRGFSFALLATSLPLAAAGFALLADYRRQAPTPLERWRTTVLMVALALATALMTTDLFVDLGFDVPALSTVGTLAFNATLTLLTLGLGLLPRPGDRVAALGQSVVLALFVSASYLVLFWLFRSRLGLLMASATTLSFSLAAMGWFFVRGAQQARAGLERFASLGRFSAQMAHDLKNPLAAARGAAEYLAEEMRRTGLPDHRDFAELIVKQLDRLGSVIERYQRLSTMTVEPAPVDLNALVQRVLSLQAFGAATVTFEPVLATPAPLLSADADLLASALENLVKNGIEAMPRGGRLEVGTRLEVLDAPTAVLWVRDHGAGMDARAREQAFELFYTTRPEGSGLGLPFVQEVARAHRGHVRLQSAEGVGTLVELLLPLA